MVHRGDLAAVAGVLVGTVCNYYVTKADILIACVTLEVEEVLLAGGGLLQSAKRHGCRIFSAHILWL